MIFLQKNRYIIKNQIKKIIRFISVFFILSNISFAQTEVYIGIENKSQTKSSIVFFNFISTTPLIEQMKEIIRSDILFSDYLGVVEYEEKIEKIEAFIQEKRKIYPFFLSVEANIENDMLYVESNLYNTLTGMKITRKYTSPASQLRRISHIISDDVIEKTVNKKGISSSRIAFSNNSTGYKEIYVVDYDGENLTQITNHKSISIVPKWSNDGKRIYYTTYKYGNPDIAYIDLDTLKIKLFSTFQGLNIPGNFSPDGSEFVVILSRGKDPSLYTLDLVNKEVKKILEDFGVCSSPAFSPDGKEIAFISDRAGNPQLYIYSTETKKARKLTSFYWADSPSWSYDGKFIAFSGRQTKDEKLNIFIIDPANSIIKRLTRNEGDNEDPTFSPDSRYIAFISTRNKQRQIFIMDRDGSRPHLLSDKITGNCYTPSWSKN